MKNQCDGCIAGHEVETWEGVDMHVHPNTEMPYMVCQRHKYIQDGKEKEDKS